MPITRVEKEFLVDPSVSDPPGQDQYEYWIYTFEVDGREYHVRRYTDDLEEAHFVSNIRNADDRALADAGLIARYLVDHEEVRAVNRYNTATGIFDRPVAPA